jgi:hypothetical protein
MTNRWLNFNRRASWLHQLRWQYIIQGIPLIRSSIHYIVCIRTPVRCYLVTQSSNLLTANKKISKLYQGFGCEYYLVTGHQPNGQPDLVPTIPALTPLGFTQWMTIHILAHPDEESKRLEKVVMNTAIDADGEMVDGKPERLPKQISRHLLPERTDPRSRKLVRNAIQDFLEDLGESSSIHKPLITSLPLSRHSTTSQPRPNLVEIHQVRASPTSPKAQPLEWERKTSAPVISESSRNEKPFKIERDRKPYTARAGCGKVHTNLNTPKPGCTNSTSRTGEPEVMETRETGHHRTRRSRRPSSPPSTCSDLPDPDRPKYIPRRARFSPPLPPPTEIRNNKERIPSDDRQYRRGTDKEAGRKGAETWDRYQEAQARESDRSYESRAAPGYDTSTRNYLN